MRTPLAVSYAEVIALAHTKHRAWRLGRVHEIRVKVKQTKRDCLTLHFASQVTERRELRGKV